VGRVHPVTCHGQKPSSATQKAVNERSEGFANCGLESKDLCWLLGSSMRILAKRMVNTAQTRYHAGQSENLLGVDNSMIDPIIDAWKQLVNQIRQFIKQWTEMDEPSSHHTHQGIHQRIPARFGQDLHPPSGKVVSVLVLGGLHHSYTRASILN
jgi:hypothetical protein